MDVAVSPAILGGRFKLTVHFVPPAGYAIDRLTILHWDGATWEDLGPLQTTDAGTFSGGVFVLAGK
jgi:hypothetical protein